MLASVAKGWKIDRYDNIRKGSGPNNICPVCAVANALLGRRKFTQDSNPAGEAIGLDREFSVRIAVAADFRNLATPAIRAARRHLVRLLNLRERAK